MRAYLRRVLTDALRAIDGVPQDFVPELMATAKPEHGDLATNCAMQLANRLRRAPRLIAQDIVQRIQLDSNRIEACEIAGPGFINFRFSHRYLHRALAQCLAEGDQYGRSATGRDQTALVEFVSANPTGPLTVGHGRNAVLGDTIANLLDWTGYQVTREYYFNNAGRQMRVLGASVRARYEELMARDTSPDTESHRIRYRTKRVPDGREGQVQVSSTFPEDGYLGEYVTEVAHALANTHGPGLLAETDPAPFTQAAESMILAGIQTTLERLGIRMDTHFNESNLYENGAVTRTLQALSEAKMVYEHDGASWFRTSALGKDTDTVLVKRTGEPTYRLPDIAYHIDKFDRGYSVMVNVFGADHIASYPDVLRGLAVLGYDASRVDVIIYQFVTLLRGGREVKMSTRKANYVTLDELLDEVGPDVTRYFFINRSANRHLEFDLDLAREASDRNPVFYLQYAHARICSILNKAVDTGFNLDRNADLTLLTHEAEIALMKRIAAFPEQIRTIAAAREPHRVGTMLRELAEAFSRFYHECRILGEPKPEASARMALARGTQTVLGNGLSILGIAAPERM